jgi:LPXTG-motif cell wall-anchored protein
VNPLTSPLHRTAAVVAGALLGLAGVVAIAGPASAHHATVTGETSCEALHADGSWTVAWTVTNSQDNIEGKLTSVELEPAGSTVTNIVESATLPLSTQPQLTGTHVVPAAAAEAKLTVDVKWDYGNGNVRWDKHKSGSVQRPENCPTTPPTTTPPTTPPTTVPPTTTPPTAPTTPVPGEGGGNPTLPKTGVPVGGIAGGAVALLAVGAGLFVLARRRRVKFTA